MKKRLYSQDAAVVVRPNRAASDAADWTPDNLSAGEISAGVIAEAVTLDAREWDDVQLVADWEKLGVADVGGALTIEILIATPDAISTVGRRWRILSTVASLTTGITALAAVRGHDAAFRITALTLGTADKVQLKVTGGTRARREKS